MINKSTTKNQKSFNGQVYEKAYKRLNLSPTQRIIFQRLLGFLIRNNKPFPFAATTLSELTGFSLRTIFNCLNDLENLRLIKRNGLGKNRRFSRGSILNKIFTTVQNRIKINLNKDPTTVQLTTQKLYNRAGGAYIKTSSSLKRKENVRAQDYQFYVTRIRADIQLGLKPDDYPIQSFDEFIISKSYS